MSSNPSKRLTDQELLEQCSTFLLAGSDSVSVAISWALHFLSVNTTIQDRLRQELASLSDVSADQIESDNSLPSTSPIALIRGGGTMRRTCSPEEDWELLDSLPYLDAVIRETLRFCPPVHGTIRVAMEDDQIPISHPIQLRDGTQLGQGDHITIRKGSYVHIPIEGLNYSEDLWGPDAKSFK